MKAQICSYCDQPAYQNINGELKLECAAHGAKYTISQIKTIYEDNNPDGCYFSVANMRFFNQKLSDFKVEQIKGRIFIYALSKDCQPLKSTNLRSLKSLMDGVLWEGIREVEAYSFAEFIPQTRKINIMRCNDMTSIEAFLSSL